MGNERRISLRVLGVTVCLGRDGDTGFCESCHVHVAGPTLTGEILCSSRGSAEVNQSIRRLLSCGQCRGEYARGSEAKVITEGFQDYYIQFTKARPGASEERQEAKVPSVPALFMYTLLESMSMSLPFDTRKSSQPSPLMSANAPPVE